MAYAHVKKNLKMRYPFLNIPMVEWRVKHWHCTRLPLGRFGLLAVWQRQIYGSLTVKCVSWSFTPLPISHFVHPWFLSSPPLLASYPLPRELLVEELRKGQEESYKRDFRASEPYFNATLIKFDARHSCIIGPVVLSQPAAILQNDALRSIFSSQAGGERRRGGTK